MLIFLAKFGMDGQVLASWKETMGNRDLLMGEQRMRESTAGRMEP